MSDKAEPTEAKATRPEEERGVVRYKSPQGVEITLTPLIVRKFFAAEADDVTALSFAAFCKWSGLNPFLREVHLAVMEGRPSIITAYTSFMKCAERHEQYRGFRAGVVLVREGEAAVPFPGVEGVVPAPLVAIEGTIYPDGYQLVGGWCTVARGDGRHVTSTVSLKEYTRYTNKGETMRMWREKPATMIRKVAVGQGHRDAFPDLAGMYLEEELGADRPLPTAPAPQPTSPPEPETHQVPPPLEPLFEKLGWNEPAQQMFLGQYRKETVEQQKARLEAEVAKLPPDGAKVQPPATATTDAGRSTTDPGAAPALTEDQLNLIS